MTTLCYYTRTRLTMAPKAKSSNASRRRQPSSNRSLELYGRRLNVAPDPPPFSSTAALVTTLDTSFNVPVGQYYLLNVTTIESILESQFGIPPASFSVSVNSLKVWLLEPGQKLTVQFFDINSSSGSPVQQEVTDWGAPTRYAAVGWMYGVGSRTTSVSGGSGAGLAAVSHSLGSPARTMARFNVRIKFKSLA